LSDLIIAENGLPLQIGPLHFPIIHDRELADARSGQCGNSRAPDSACTDNRDGRCFQPPLADASDLRKNDMPRVAVQFVVA
jgi:hypothetical protein